MATKDQKLIAQIVKNRQTAETGWRDIYEKSLADTKFVYNIDNAQWPSDDKSGLQLTGNALQKFILQIGADAKQSRPRMKVIPVDSGADVDKAQLYNDLIRQIEHLSNASIAYDTAFMQAVAGSIGFFRIVTERSNPFSLNQSVKIKRIRNPHTVRFDPSAREFNYEDARYCFIDDWMDRDDFKEKYPKANPGDIGSGDVGQSLEGWFSEDKVRVAEYYYKVDTKFTLVRVQATQDDGTVITQDVELTPAVQERIDSRGMEIIDQIESVKTEVKWVKMTGLEILDRTDWPGKHIPVIPVQGNEIVVDGKRHLLSFHRGAQDLQRMLNFFLTKATKVMAKTPDVPFILTADQLGKYKRMWEEDGAMDRAFLLYEETQAGKPSRENQITPPTGMLTMIQQLQVQLEDHLSMFDATKGAPSNERSGTAINARINQSAKGSFVFVDNFARALVFSGKQVVDLIPKIYDTQRAEQVRGENGDTELQQINQPTGELDQFGQPVIENDLSVGEFDLIETVGASSQSARQEELEDLIQAVQYAGPAAPALIPWVFKLRDSPHAAEIAEDVKKALSAPPPGGQPSGQPQQ